MIRALFVYRYCTMGGVETGLRFRIQALPRHGIDAHVLFLRDYGGRPAFTELDGRVFFHPSEAEFADLVHANDYDLISVIDSFDVFDWLERMDFPGRVLVELRSTYEHTLVQLKRLAGHRLDAVLVPSRFQAQNIQKYLPKDVRTGVPVHIVPNFVDPRRFQYTSSGGSRNDYKIVCWVGRIDPLKNWEEFLAIAEQMAERDDVEFWMVGGGGSDQPHRESFRQAVEKRRLAARLRWWPLVANPRMPALYSLVADSGGAVILTTKCESFGFAALEAMACRCPLVAARVGALPEVVKHGVTGLLYASGREHEAVAALTRILDDAALRRDLVERGAESVRKELNPAHCAARFAEVVQTVSRPKLEAVDARWG